MNAVAGYVEAVTETAVLGWAWSPARPALRLTVGLYRGEECLATTIADREREDLASGGIGDGRHAFSLAIPEAARSEIPTLTIKAGADGEAPVAIGAPPAAPGLADRLDSMQRTLELLAGSQRVLHRTLQAALVKPEAPTEEDATLGDRLRAVELALLRLDERLAQPTAIAGPRRSRPVAAMAVLAAICLAGSLWELRLALLG